VLGAVGSTVGGFLFGAVIVLVIYERVTGRKSRA
jgi:hypothetical protein